MKEIEVGTEKTNSKVINFYKANSLDEDYILLVNEYE
jgi:hypothetical protein